MSKTIAVVGLGNMGAPMSANLVKAGNSVAGFDLSKDACSVAAATGVKIAGNAADAVKDAGVLITMLPKGEHVLSVWNDLVPRLPKGTLVIDCSTIDVASARAAHEIAAKAACLSLDAPVSGGIAGAAGATLTFMVGGQAAAFDLGKPVLEKMGKRVVHCGDAGAGQAAKICNNMVLGASMIAVCEAFVLGEKLGLKHQAIFDVVSTSSGQCWSVSSYCPVPGPVPASPANNAYKPGFAASLMLKDLTLAQEAARSVKSATPIGDQALDLYRKYNEAGQSGKDFSGIIEFLRERSGS